MKILKSILLGLLGISIALVVILAASIAFDEIIGSQRIKAINDTTIPRHSLD